MAVEDHIFLHVDKEELDRRVGHWHPLLECHLILAMRTFLQKLADSAVKGLSQKETILWLIIPENCCVLILKSSPWSFVSWVVWASVKMATCQHVTLSNTSTVIPWFENLHQITQIISWIYRLNLHQRRLVLPTFGFFLKAWRNVKASSHWIIRAPPIQNRVYQAPKTTLVFTESFCRDHWTNFSLVCHFYHQRRRLLTGQFQFQLRLAEMP